MSNILSDSFAGSRVLVTGHTGFKGSWLVKYLSHLGARVTGLSLDPLEDSLYLGGGFIPNNGDFRIDIRDEERMKEFFENNEFDIVFHLAAQPLVSLAYSNPLETFEVNSIGTSRVVLYSSKMVSCKGIVVVTTDKVYKPNDKLDGHREGDALGGLDPYSASKSAAELLVVGIRNVINRNDFKIVSVRAGNVIGGGDLAANRLVPDLVRALKMNTILVLRNPSYVRPWMHVLDVLNGYLIVGQRILLSQDVSEAYNFGPDNSEIVDVSQIVEYAIKHWEGEGSLKVNHIPSRLLEDHFLLLNSELAKKELKWRAKYSIETSIMQTMSWWKECFQNQNPAQLVEDEVAKYESN